MDEEKLSQWVKDITAGSSFSRKDSLPNKTQLASLLSVKSFPPVLDYIVKHVRPRQERQHIRLNLKNSYFRKHLVEEKNVTDVQRRHSMLKSLVQDAEKELRVETEELKGIVEEERKLQLEEKNVRSQIVLFNIACRERAESTKKLKEQNEAVANLLPQSSKFVSPEDESIKQKLAAEDLDCILAKLKALREKILDNKNGDFHDQKVEVWNLVEMLLARHSPAIMLKALSSITCRETDIILQTTSAVDLIADAKALNLKYSNGVFTDVLNPHGVVETVESMMIQMSAKHIKKHLALQKLKQDTKLTKDSLLSIGISIQSVLNEHDYDPLLVSGIIDLFNATIRVSGLKATMSAASAMIRDLETRADIARKGKESIMEKYNKITNFDEIVEKRNEELKQLVLAISQGLKELDEEKENVTSAVNDSVASLVLPTPFLKGAFSMECNALQNIPFEALATLHTEYGRIPCPSSGPVADLYSDLSDLSEVVPYVTPWENVMETIRQRKARIKYHETRSKEELSDFEMAKKNPVNETLSIYAVKALQQKVQAHDQRLEEEILPILQKCEEINKNGEKIVARFKEVMEDWWSQPGSEIKQYLKQ